MSAARSTGPVDPVARARLRRRVRGLQTVAGAAVAANRARAAGPQASGSAPLAAPDRLPRLDLSAPPWPGESVDVAGAEIFVRRTPTRGEGPHGVAVHVHGLGGASTNWTDLAGQLSPWVTSYALDLPGFGRSGPSPTGRYSIAEHARVLTRYLDEVVPRSGGRVHLSGNSMGGAVAIAVAARRPDLVGTLTLVSPAVPDLRVRRDDDPRTPLLMLPGLGALALRRLAEVTPEQRARGVIDLCFGDPSRVPEHRRREAADELRERRGMSWGDDAFLRSMKGLVRSWFSARPWDDLAALRVPTLVVWGDRDRLVDPRLAPRVAAAVPGARLLVLPGVGHVAQLEDPVTVARAVLALYDDAATDDAAAGVSVPAAGDRRPPGAPEPARS